MKKEKLPIKFFAPREIDELRVEPGGNPDPPKWLLSGEALEQRAKKLSTEFDEFEVQVLEKKAKSSLIPFIFLAKMSDGSTAKSRRKEIANLFLVKNSSNIIGLAESDELIVRLDSITEMKTISSRLGDPDRHNFAISCLDSFIEYEPFLVEGEGVDTYKVKLVDFQDYELNVAIQRLFERTLSNKGISFDKTDYSDQYFIYKLSEMDKTLLDGLQETDVYEAIFSVEPMPKYSITLDSLDDHTAIAVSKPIDGKDYVTIGILDNGIASIPHLAPWLVGDRWTVYPKTSINPTHGTFVAGIALYGDTCEGKNWVGHQGVLLFDATVFPDTKEGIEEDELIENIKEAIKANHGKVRIWNLSISVENEISDNKFSDFAIALDALQDQYNVLICKSAGNCLNFLSSKAKGRLHEGADSIRSLVVGSVAHAKGKFDFSDVDNPSPFSRIGPGPEFIIKPEISHYGGNAGIDNTGKLVATGVTSFSKDGSLSNSIGTSVSTPRITSLAAGIYQGLHEGFDSLLLRALIIHSASYSKELKVPITERTKQLGFGIPKTVSEILYNSPHEATLILRDSLTKGSYIDIMDFPMPTSLIKDGYFTGQITVTLVYDPILDPTQGIEYCQSNIDVKFGSYDEKSGRDISKRNILNPVGRKGAKNLLLGSNYSKTRMRENTGDFALRERLLIQYADKYYPVKKYAVDLSELSDTNKRHYLTQDKHWYLKVSGLFRDHVERQAALNSVQLSQEMCLILTISDPTGKANIYDEVTQKLDEFNFWHNNVNISSDINIRI